MTKILLSLLVLMGNLAHAEIVTVPGSQGRLLNHTALPNEAFELSFTAWCQTDAGYTCGRFEQTTLLKADGTYQIPAFTLDAGATDPTIRRYSLLVFISLPADHPQRPKSTAPGDFAAMVDIRKASIQQLQAKNFTLHATDSGLLNVKLASGRKLDDYLKNEGRDGGVNIEIDFGLTGGRRSGLNHSIDQSGFTRKNWLELPVRYFMTPAELAADAPFDYVIRSQSQEIKKGRANFSSNLISAIGLLEIDDRQSEDLVAERRLTGSFADSYFQLDYPLQDQMEFDEIGFSYATLNVECVKGQIVGELIYRDGQWPDDPETSRVTVGGLCQGDSGQIVWTMKRKSGKLETLTAKYDRIRAQNLTGPNGNSKISRMLFSSDVRDRMGEWKGEELTIFMPAYFADGTYAGDLRVATAD